MYIESIRRVIMTYEFHGEEHAFEIPRKTFVDVFGERERERERERESAVRSMQFHRNGQHNLPRMQTGRIDPAATKLASSIDPDADRSLVRGISSVTLNHHNRGIPMEGEGSDRVGECRTVLVALLILGHRHRLISRVRIVPG